MPNPPPLPPPPPPPPVTPPNFEMLRNREEKKRMGDWKKNNATKEIANTFVSLYRQRKRKEKQKLENEASGVRVRKFIQFHTLPPPLPPSSSTQKSNGKKNLIFSPQTPSKPPMSPISRRRARTSEGKPPSPAPPLPPSSSTQKSKGKKNLIFSPQTPSKPPMSPISRRRARTSDEKPPPPVRAKNFYEKDNDLNNRGQSPLIPAPPWRLPKMKFVVQGDFVRIRSTHSSRCSSTCVWNV
ncbi:hypothetical protein Ancab_015966 [Ancistrocladus abbreviatus]